MPQNQPFVHGWRLASTFITITKERRRHSIKVDAGSETAQRTQWAQRGDAYSWLAASIMRNATATETQAGAKSSTTLRMMNCFWNYGVRAT
ncbi:hypothetical protein BIW11_04614 [Tropilaelaps mercedesae]|uniref:Uncharacterized protein n=1 Tax=Tropilaelaps mercedesae TaxID=418985 RepID=A0A1V9X417_9ACAR|nr:hypothetical protein BIW11_04614 [Tropilaelaps mercedesae]